MRIGRRELWTGVVLVVVATGALFAGMQLATPPAPLRATALERDAAVLGAALEAYHADHGWYPADPDRDYNSDGRAELLRRQLTWFTRDDGKPADRRDTEYCYGPYLREWPVDPLTGSGAVVVDQDQARPLVHLRRDVAAGLGRGGWYYEARTGNLVPNHGRGRRSRYARF